jgi:predicted Zn finger-like uncharacterized protein
MLQVRDGDAMLASKSFHCPNCDALYQVVQSEAGPETVDQGVTCRVCNAPFSAGEGPFILKYFLLRERTRRKKVTSKSK